MQSAAMRMHSSACFREWSDSDTAHLLETQVLHRCTASRVLSVVYATEKRGENSGCAHPGDDGIVESAAQMRPLTSFSEERICDARVGRALRKHVPSESFFERAAEPVFQF